MSEDIVRKNFNIHPDMKVIEYNPGKTKASLERYQSYNTSMLRALKIIDLIDTTGIGRTPLEDPNIKDKIFMEHQLYLIAIIHYSVPFSSGFDYKVMFDDAGQEFHRKIFDLRNEFIAHDDGMRNEVVTYAVIDNLNKCTQIAFTRKNETIHGLVPGIHLSFRPHVELAKEYFYNRLRKSLDHEQNMINQLSEEDRSDFLRFAKKPNPAE